MSAATRADSHRINQNGAADLAEIDDYIALLSRVNAAQLVLISTVCIYPGGTSPDESTPLSADGLTPYGANRLHMEQTLCERFNTLALRLPQLYGIGLKKGIVYDLLNDYRIEFIRPEGRFQYYDLRRLWADTERALQAGLRTLNIATPPLTSARVAAECFGIDIADQVVGGEESAVRPDVLRATCEPFTLTCSADHLVTSWTRSRSWTPCGLSCANPDNPADLTQRSSAVARTNDSERIQTNVQVP